MIHYLSAKQCVAALCLNYLYQVELLMKIRVVEENDAAGMVELFHALDAETDYMFFEPGERKTTVDEQRGRIRNLIQNSGSIFIVAEGENNLAGFAAGISQIGNRHQHVVNLVIGIRETQWRKGIGAKFMDKIESWARENDKSKIELTVIQDNKAAIALYESRGYEKEGIKRKSVKIGKAYTNEIYMGKFLGETVYG